VATLVEAQIELAENSANGSIDWGIYYGNYLKNVLMHEIGYTLGLDHPKTDEIYGEPVMRSYAVNPPVFIDYDDVNGNRSLYGFREPS